MVSQKYRWDFIGLSTDTKPTSETSDKVVNGSTYYCSDTSKLYVYCDGTWYERKPLGGGGGGGTSNFNDLSNRPKYNGSEMTGSTNIPEVKNYTAGTNVSISDQNVISATDTTYSNFTGTDGSSAGEAGLVPAPATTDAGKYLKADGTWDTVQAGPTVVQTTGTSTTDVMSQNAVSSMVFADPGSALGSNQKIRIGEGATVSGNRGVAIGAYSSGSGYRSVALGDSASATGRASVALAYSNANSKGEFAIGVSGTEGYNSSAYRLISGVYDGQSAHDAATKGQLDSIAIQNAGAPTTATVGTVGQLLEDTTNGKLYICTDTTGGSYTWAEVGAGGGSGPTVVQTTGTSTTDVMSQNAVTSMIFADPATQYKIKIGAGTSASEGNDGIEIGHNASATKANAMALGPGASATGNRATAIGQASNAQSDSAVAIGGATVRTSSPYAIAIGYASEVRANTQGAIAIGDNALATVKGQFDISTLADGASSTRGYNSSPYRLLTGLYDPQSAHDAANKEYVDPTTDSSAPTTATVGRLGQIYIDTTTATAYMCVAVDTVTPAYTWKQITA